MEVLQFRNLSISEKESIVLQREKLSFTRKKA